VLPVTIETSRPSPSPSPVFRKGFVVVLVTLLLLVPIGMLRGLVAERIQLAGEAKSSVAAGWGGQQQVGGPMLVVPLTQVTRDSRGRAIEKRIFSFTLPDTLEIDTTLESESRRLGIYTVPVYQARMRVRATFTPVDVAHLAAHLPAIADADCEVHWDQAHLLLPVTEVKAIRALENARWNDEPLRFVGGGATQHAGVRATLDTAALRDGEPGVFTAELTVAGSEQLRFLPLGRTTGVTMRADWPHPGFTGNYLPAERDITDEGFTARWQVLELNRDYPQHWVEAPGVAGKQLDRSSFGVNLFLPADIYQRNDRSMKYALLFIVMTFASLFLVEHLLGPQLHAVQYVLVGLALSMFFLLLLALSEHIGFDAAYWLATSSLVALTGVYLSGALRSRRRGWIAAAGFALLYATLYVILNAAETALLIGSLSLFAVLAAMMLITRKVDWNTVGQ
jgi:inner membrane protein